MLKINKNKFIAKFPNKNVIGQILKKKNNKLSKVLLLLKGIIFLITINKIGCGGRI